MAASLADGTNSTTGVGDGVTVGACWLKKGSVPLGKEVGSGDGRGGEGEGDGAVVGTGRSTGAAMGAALGSGDVAFDVK